MTALVYHEDYVGFDANGHAVTIGTACPDVLQQMAESPRIKRIERHPLAEACRLHGAYLALLPEFADLFCQERAGSP